MNQPKKTLPRNIPLIRLDSRSLTLPLLLPQSTAAQNCDLTIRLLQNMKALEEKLAISQAQLANKQKQIQVITRSFAQQLRFGSSAKSTKEMAVQVSNQNYQFKTCMQQFLLANLDYASVDSRKFVDSDSQTDCWTSLKQEQSLSQSLQTISLVSNHQWQAEEKREEIAFFKKIALDIFQLQKVQISSGCKSQSIIEHCFDHTVSSKRRSAFEQTALESVWIEGGRRRQRVKAVECLVMPQVRKKPFLFHHRIIQTQINYFVTKQQSKNQTEPSVQDFAVQSEPSFPPSALHLELSQAELPDPGQISTLPISATFGEVKSEKSLYNKSEFEQRQVRNEFVDLMQRNARRRQQRFRQRAEQSPLSDFQPQEIGEGHQHVYFCGHQAHLRPSEMVELNSMDQGHMRRVPNNRELSFRMDVQRYQQAEMIQANNKPFFRNYRPQSASFQDVRDRDNSNLGLQYPPFGRSPGRFGSSPKNCAARGGWA